ncbi:hypothetical protein CW304_24705 [Bacillus sp. UFRGS-B20]|nr:hypothetical protein CW304_24705 [Bacillus sp. UFRGS-B20]
MRVPTPKNFVLHSFSRFPPLMEPYKRFNFASHAFFTSVAFRFLFPKISVTLDFFYFSSNIQSFECLNPHSPRRNKIFALALACPYK